MSFAEEMQAVAYELLSEFDERTEKMKLIVKSAPFFDPVLGEDVFTVDAEYNLIGITSNYKESLVDGTTIQSGDIKIIAVCDVHPVQKDKVLVDGSILSIVEVNPVAYTGKDKIVLYKLRVRK